MRRGIPETQAEQEVQVHHLLDRKQDRGQSQENCRDRRLQRLPEGVRLTATRRIQELLLLRCIRL